MNKILPAYKKIEPILVTAMIIIGSSFLLVVFFHQLTQSMNDNDLFWQLSSGKLMVATKSILRVDLMSHTLYGANWITIGWLGQIFLFSLHNIFGFMGIYVWKILFCLSSFGLFIALINQSKVNKLWGLFLVWIGFSIIYFRFNEKLELFTLNFFPLFLFLLLKAKKASQKQLKPIPWILFLIMSVWVNIHAGFVYGILLVACVNAGARISGERKAYRAMLDRSIVLTLLATFLNPDGPAIYNLFFGVLLNLSKDATVITEYLPPELYNYPSFWVVVGLSFWCVCWGLYKKDKTILFWTPLLVVFSLCGAKYTRCITLIAFVALPFFGVVIKNRKRKVRFHGDRLTITLIFSLVAILWGIKANHFPSAYHRIRSIVNWQYFPTEACRFVHENKISGNMYNEFNWGGFIYWALGPEGKIFMDGRYIFHSLAIQHVKLRRNLLSNPFDNGWQDYFDKYKINYSIEGRWNVLYQFPEGSVPFRMSRYNLIYPRSKWALVFWDDTALVFLRRNAQNQALIGEYEYKAIRPYNLDQMDYLLKNRLIKRSDVEKELKRHLGFVGYTKTREKILSLL